MKQFFFISLLMLTFFGYSQEKENDYNSKKNELKVNIGAFVAGFPVITYERALTHETSFGVSLGVLIDSDDGDTERFDFSLIPYYRIHFGETPNTGFFIDGNAAIYSQKSSDESLFVNEKKGGLGFGLGFNIGKKYKTKNGWVGETSFGLTRTVINSDQVHLIYPRFSITVGKAF